MPIQLEELLKPISSEQPAGADLRYAPVYMQIREGRRYEEEISQGDWKREIKTADYVLVADLAKKALKQQGKDLQIAAWLTEALLAREGIPGLQQGLELLYGLLNGFWETVYPLIEDGEMDMRANPLSWVGSQLDLTLKRLPVTLDGVRWLDYSESRTVPTEEDAQSNNERAASRQEAIEAGKLTPEKFEKAFEATPVQYYEKLRADLRSVLEFVGTLASFCDEKFGAEAPDFSPLRTSLEEFGKTVHVLFMRKGGRDLGAAGEPESHAGAEESGGETQYAEPVPEPSYSGAPAPAKRAPVRRQAAGAEPVDENAALEQIISAAHYLRKQNLSNPVPYLVLRALQWGQLRAAGYVDPSAAHAPSTEVRVALKNLFSTSDFEGVVNAGEQAMATSCGQTWIDLQRFIVRACRFTGNDHVARAIVADLKALLGDFPELLDLTLNDDTPAVNAETKAWLLEEGILAAKVEPVPEAAAAPIEPWSMPEPAPHRPDGQGLQAEFPPPDVYDLAYQAARSGRGAEAIRMLAEEVQREQTGREKFLRTSQLAQICLASGKKEIALPILKQLAAEIDEHRLESWESRDVIVKPLSMLYGFGEHPDLYERICRIDPVWALDIRKL